MANIIITIIAIALVAVATLMSVYYGGAAHKAIKIRAQAATIKNQISAMAAAKKMSVIDGNSVSSLADLVNDGYLTDVPSYEGYSWSITPTIFTISVATEDIITAELCLSLDDMFDAGQISCNPGEFGNIDFTF